MKFQLVCRKFQLVCTPIPERCDWSVQTHLSEGAHVWWGERENTNLSWELIYKECQRIEIFRIRQKKQRKLSDEHRFTPLQGNTKPNSENTNL